MFGSAIHVRVALTSSQTRSESGGLLPRFSVSATRPASEAVIVPFKKFPPALLKTTFLVSTSKVKKYGMWFLSSMHRSVTGPADAG
jgi:hypothetical protein